MAEGQSNLELAKEAASTESCERQCILAEVQSEVVIKALRNNPHLCDAARAILDRTSVVQQETADATSDTLGDV